MRTHVLQTQENTVTHKHSTDSFEGESCTVRRELAATTDYDDDDDSGSASVRLVREVLCGGEHARERARRMQAALP